MNQLETLAPPSPFPFAELAELKKDVADSNEKKTFGFESPVYVLPAQFINNYLKTPAEMDAEFDLEMNTQTRMIKERNDHFDTYKKIALQNQATNAYRPDDIPSGYMEENY